MYIIFEEHQYDAGLVQDVLREISTLQDVEQKVSVSYVGYYYNTKLKDCVFILPKVLLKWDKKTGRDYVFGVRSEDKDDASITPENIITPEGQQKFLSPEYRKFVYEFAVWVYRALRVYKEDKESDSKILFYKSLPQEGNGRRQKASTLLDVILSLIRFSIVNQDFVLFTVKNLHAGHNKINWTRTIAKSQAVMQHGAPVYMQPVNKRKMVNFDEELFIIFFSIINYVNEQYGFSAPINLHFDIIPAKQFERYLTGLGKRRLMEIRYKYFSDKALELWELCYAFFEFNHQLNINVEQKEYLLAKNFNIVFEAIIDELIGDPRSKIPQGLKDQDDGKRVDHMYEDIALDDVDGSKGKSIYYIGDSKYYKHGHPLGRESVYKQFTYARNVIQWNMDLFNGKLKDESEEGRRRLRDKNTEGYNVTPNFFISAFVDENRNYDAPAVDEDQEDGNIRPHGEKGENHTHISYHVEDRLFDRDTLIVSHYDVNFLYVLYLYARNKQGEKAWWKEKVRGIFRKEIRKVLEDKYNFYALKPKQEQGDDVYFKEHFKDILGKIYRPDGNEAVYSLALPQDDNDPDNAAALKALGVDEFFHRQGVKLGDDLEGKLKGFDTQSLAKPTKLCAIIVQPKDHILAWCETEHIVPIAQHLVTDLGALANAEYLIMVNTETDEYRAFGLTHNIKFMTNEELKARGYSQAILLAYIVVEIENTNVNIDFAPSSFELRLGYETKMLELLDN